MATCTTCNREMLAAPGCIEHLNIYRYGEAPSYPGEKQLQPRCNDCGAQPGQPHHTDCDQAYCTLDNLQVLAHGPHPHLAPPQWHLDPKPIH